MRCAIAVGISEASAVDTVKSISTGIAACTTVVDVGLGIGADTIAAWQSFTCARAIDAIIAFATGCGVISAMRRGIGFACHVGAIIVKMGIANTCRDLALPGFCTNAIAPVRNGGTVHASAMLGIVGYAGITIQIVSCGTLAASCSTSPMRGSVARTRIGCHIIRFFYRIAGHGEFTDAANLDIAIFAGAGTGCADEMFIIVART